MKVRWRPEFYPFISCGLAWRAISMVLDCSFFAVFGFEPPPSLAQILDARICFPAGACSFLKLRMNRSAAPAFFESGRRRATSRSPANGYRLGIRGGWGSSTAMSLLMAPVRFFIPAAVSRSACLVQRRADRDSEVLAMDDGREETAACFSAPKGSYVGASHLIDGDGGFITRSQVAGSVSGGSWRGRCGSP